nr:hypothetical protein [Ralstonia pseudosolanacearum]
MRFYFIRFVRRALRVDGMVGHPALPCALGRRDLKQQGQVLTLASARERRELAPDAAENAIGFEHHNEQQSRSALNDCSLHEFRRRTESLAQV